jgi:DNA-binding NarL/FixJ family response regulator
MREPRPHRPALDAEAARRELERDVRDKRLDETAVQAVLEAGSGRRTSHTLAQWPSGLSDREVQVLRLVARGSTNKEVASELGISAKTVQHHVAHVYDKIGVTSRAGAALFATEHALLDPE